jgi:hypothetical protein
MLLHVSLLILRLELYPLEREVHVGEHGDDCRLQILQRLPGEIILREGVCLL